MNKGDNVMVTTEYRGVFFGQLVESNGKTVKLKDAQNCIYWSSDCRGVFGLASKGPNGKCKIGPRVPEITIYKVASITLCTDEAKDAWRKEPWG